jgi:hypothetical protein
MVEYLADSSVDLTAAHLVEMTAVLMAADWAAKLAVWKDEKLAELMVERKAARMEAHLVVMTVVSMADPLVEMKVE